MSVNQMFCFQCQEALNNKGCTRVGVCGKNSNVASLQDLLIYATKGLCAVTSLLRKEGKAVSKEIDTQVTENLFATITNANFDEEALTNMIRKTLEKKEDLLSQISNKDSLQEASLWHGTDLNEMIEKASGVGVLSTEDEDIRSLKELITYGLKGLCAYNQHANVLAYKKEEVDIFVQETLTKLLDPNSTVEELVNLTLETGKHGVYAMALLNEANIKTYGSPVMTEVSLETRNNPGILVSGHDLKDMEMLLIQAKEAGVDIYTHSEMLPAHYYPELKKFSNLVGNYGNAWWKQTEEFESFNGPILMTTNCIVPPRVSYKDRLYTTGVAGYPACTHIEEDENGYKDFSQIISHAKGLASPTKIEDGSIIGGFAYDQVMALADKVIAAVKEGAIKKFVVMAGCDGRHKTRNYYTEFAKALPKDTVILTAGCAKYRYNKLNLGDIGGIPRVLDAGQCNDSYSLALIALKLKEVFEVDDLNDLPIIYNIAWYEQKAVIVLLALLYLGVKDIHLGPSLPAFLSENVVKVLVDNFGISGISTVEEDIEAFFA